MVKKTFEIYKPGRGEIEVKKSVFMGEVFSVKNEDEAAGFVTAVKKKHYDARHHCYAYVLGDENSIRAADDGEPQGTAGRPILDLILGENLRNTLVVVTRYFGGTLLGTGGLTRAYRDAAGEALADSIYMERLFGVKTEIVLSYDQLGKAENLLMQREVTKLSSDYTDIVSISFITDESNLAFIEKGLLEIGCGTILINKSQPVNYSVTSEGVIWL